MIKYHYNIEQGTDEWLQSRCGIITGSMASVIMTPTGKPADNKTSRDYYMKLAAERVTGRIEYTPTSYHMERGKVEEEIAKTYYKKDVKECGIITNEKLGFKFGYSPDGLIDRGLIEVKSRMNKSQISTVISDSVPHEYIPQIQFGLYATGLEYCDFIQYSNGMPLFTKEVRPDLQHHENLENALRRAEVIISEYVEKFQESAEKLTPTEYVNHFEEEDMIEASA